MASCGCVKRHQPKPLAFQVHHVVPKSWKGQDVASNRVTICGTTHDNVHHALDQVVRVAYAGERQGSITTKELAAIVKPYNAYAAQLILRAVEGVGLLAVPNVYTIGGHTHA